MAERRCGYCRQFGHNASKCSMKSHQIEAARLHVGRQRKELAQLLTMNGFGVGALVNAYVYGADDEVPCLVTQDSLDSVANLSFVEYFNIKYSKRASVRLNSYNGSITVPDSDSEVMTLMRGSLYFKVTPMQTGLSDSHVNIHISDLPLGPNNLKGEQKRNYPWDRYCELLAPSYDGAMSEEALHRKFHIHHRLGMSFATPLFP